MRKEINRYRFKHVRYLITEENQRSWTSKKYHLVSNFYWDLFLFDKEKYFFDILPQPKNILVIWDGNIDLFLFRWHLQPLTLKRHFLKKMVVREYVSHNTY